MVDGKRLKHIRKQRKMTQRTLAEKVNVAMNTISRYETGERELTNKIMEKLSTVLNILSPVFETNIVSDEEFYSTDIDEICYHLNEFNKAYFGEPFATLEITDYQIEFEIQEALKTLNIEGKKAVKHYIDDISLIPKYLAPDSSSAPDHEEGEGVNKTDTPG